MKEIRREIVPIYDEDLFIILDHPNADFNYAVHFHSEYEINLIMNTYGQRIIGDSIEPFSHIDLVMVGPNLRHAWRGHTIEGNHVITIQFSDELLNMPIMNKRLFTPIRNLLLESKKGLYYSEEIAEKIKPKIIGLTHIHGFQSVIEFFSLLYDMSIADHSTIVSNAYDSGFTVMTQKSRRITKVCEYISQHFDKDVTLGKVAEQVGMSESAFSHFFKSKTGTTFIDYLNDLRIAKACRLLIETNKTVSEVCFECGYNNISNFIRMFRKRKDTTPNEFRVTINKMLLKY